MGVIKFEHYILPRLKTEPDAVKINLANKNLPSFSLLSQQLPNISIGSKHRNLTEIKKEEIYRPVNSPTYPKY
jgi:hypothetical protein